MLRGFALVSCFARARDRHHHIISFTMPSMRSPPSHWYTPSLGTPVPVNQAMPASIRPFHFHKCTPTTLVAYVCRSFKYYGTLVLVLLLPMCQRQIPTTVFPTSSTDLSFPSVAKDGKLQPSFLFHLPIFLFYRLENSQCHCAWAPPEVQRRH